MITGCFDRAGHCPSSEVTAFSAYVLGKMLVHSESLSHASPGEVVSDPLWCSFAEQVVNHLRCLCLGRLAEYPVHCQQKREIGGFAPQRLSSIPTRLAQRTGALLCHIYRNMSVPQLQPMWFPLHNF